MGGDTGRASTWSGAEYAARSGHHRAFDDWFLERCPPSPSDVIVDLGCGSGEFSASLASLVPDGRVVGVDRDPSMLEQAHRHAAANLTFEEASADRVDEVLEPGSVDMVVSRAMLHWLPLSRYERVFAGVRRILAPGGWFHSESAGAGNVAKVGSALEGVAAELGLGELPAFPDAGVVFDLVEAAGFDMPDEAVRTIAQRRAFSRDELVAFLRTQATVALTRSAPAEDHARITDAVAATVEDLRRHDGSYDQTFVRLEILARRPA